MTLTTMRRMLPSLLMLLSGLIVALSSIPTVQAHGYLMSPRSRNYKAAQDGVWSGGGTTDEPKESCPHCLNRGGTLGQCGISGNRNYDLPLNVYGNLLPAAPQATYAAGQTVTVDVVLTAHHKGHFEFAVCPLQHGEIPTATCFDRVEVVEDLLYGAPQDSNYPFRAYIPPASYSGLINHNDNGGGPSGSLYRYKVKLPDGLTGDLVLFQWKYLTANSCEYPGYSSYNWPSDWPVYNKLPLCGPLPPDGDGVPEQFWNCAEVSISDGPVVPTTPAPVPPPSTSFPTISPYPMATYNPDPPTATAVPTTAQPVPIVGNCGGGNPGNGICSNPTLCCSEWGWCGTSSAHCSNPTSQPKATPAPVPTTPFPTIHYTPPPQSSSCDSTQSMSVNIGYYQSWAIWRPADCNPFQADTIDVSGNGYTHLIYSFAGINANYAIEPWGGDTYGEVPQYQRFNSLKESHPNLKTLIAVGGWTFNDPGPTQTRFSQLSASSVHRQTFAASVVTFCQTHGFDGIDFDWEYPGDTSRGGTAADKQNYSLLVEAVRTAFANAAASSPGNEMMLISMAVPISAWRLGAGYDLPGLAANLDFFNLMTYDIHGTWDNPPVIGSHTDIRTITDGIEYILDQGVPGLQLVMGMAAYGRSYLLADPACATAGCSFAGPGPGGCGGEPGYLPYFSIVDIIDTNRVNSLVVNRVTGSMEMRFDGNKWVSFDTNETFRIKHDLGTNYCFRGHMWWAVDMKDEPIKLVPVEPPTTPMPVETPSKAPSDAATAPPVPAPVPDTPSEAPSALPSVSSAVPSVTPSDEPSKTVVVTPVPTISTTPGPTKAPTISTTPGPTKAPTISTTPGPTKAPTMSTTPGPTKAPTMSTTPEPTKAPTPDSLPVDDWVLSTAPRCGKAEADARGLCGKVCTTNLDCDYMNGEWCWGVHPNYCGSKPVSDCPDTAVAVYGHRCGTSELMARELCGVECTYSHECNTAAGESCFAVNPNFCACTE